MSLFVARDYRQQQNQRKLRIAEIDALLDGKFDDEKKLALEHEKQDLLAELAELKTKELQAIADYDELLIERRREHRRGKVVNSEDVKNFRRPPEENIRRAMMSKSDRVKYCAVVIPRDKVYYEDALNEGIEALVKSKIKVLDENNVVGIVFKDFPSAYAWASRYEIWPRLTREEFYQTYCKIGSYK